MATALIRGGPSGSAPATRRATVLVVANQKGGVGKTTTAQALASAIAETGDSVLLADVDPQASLTEGLGYAPESLDPTLGSMLERYLADGRPPDLRGAIRAVGDHLDLLPSNLSLARAEHALIGYARPQCGLRELLAPLRSEYDWLVVDCPPSLSLLTVNALAFADRVVIPVQPEPWVVAMLKRFLETIGGIRRQRINPQLQVAGIVLTRTTGRTTLTRDVVDRLREMVGDAIPVLGEVRASIRVQEAAALRVPLLGYRPAAGVAAEYRQIAEVLRGARQRT
jgi:chromosome partitioning protein